MYELITKERKNGLSYNQSLFEKLPILKEDDAKLFISHQIVNELSEDMLDFSCCMTKTILEGLLKNGRKNDKR